MGEIGGRAVCSAHPYTRLPWRSGRSPALPYPPGRHPDRNIDLPLGENDEQIFVHAQEVFLSDEASRLSGTFNPRSSFMTSSGFL